MLPRPQDHPPFPWRLPGLTRAERVIAFLEFLPITKGILRGKRMRLLPHQREFVERVYSGNVRLAISSSCARQRQDGPDCRACLLPPVRARG